MSPLVVRCYIVPMEIERREVEGQSQGGTRTRKWPNKFQMSLCFELVAGLLAGWLVGWLAVVGHLGGVGGRGVSEMAHECYSVFHFNLPSLRNFFCFGFSDAAALASDTSRESIIPDFKRFSEVELRLSPESC